MQVLYTTRWNGTTRRPTLGHTWVSENEARALYDSGKGIEVVDARARDGRGIPLPAWVIGASFGFRVQVFTPGGSVARIVDWDRIEGRLWRWVTNEYTYPDEHSQYPMTESSLIVKTSVRPDGTGSLSIDDKDSGHRHVTQFADIATDGFWLDVPEFGEWGPLVNATLLGT